MTKINLYTDKIYIKSTDVLNALNTKKEFIIDIYGSIKYQWDNSDIIIFQGAFPSSSLSKTPPTLKSVLGDGYIVKFVDNQFEINCMGAWQRVSAFNLNNATYDDGGEGINEFDDKELEEIGWWATDFDINYRTLVEIIEEKCEMILLCNEVEGDNYMFAGLGFVQDLDCAREQTKLYAIQEITKKINNDEIFAKHNLDDTQLEALNYFNIRV